MLPIFIAIEFDNPWAEQPIQRNQLAQLRQARPRHITNPTLAVARAKSFPDGKGELRRLAGTRFKFMLHGEANCATLVNSTLATAAACGSSQTLIGS